MASRKPVPPRKPRLIEREWLRREYEDNLRTAEAISRDADCCKATVYRALEWHGIPIREKRRAGRLARSGVDFDDAKAVELYLAGYSMPDLVRHFGSSPNTVLGVLRRAGVVRTKREAAILRRDVTKRRMPRASAMIGVLTSCAACGRSEGLELHHVDADSTNNSAENLIGLCWEHHMLVEMLVTRALLGLKRRGILDSIG